MSKIKKLILGLSVAVTMAIAFVVGFAGLNQPKATNNTPSAPDCELVTPGLKQDKPATYNHAPNTITVKKGGDTINYSYRPDVTAMANEKVVAYEYCFGSTDVDMAVDIKELDGTGVNVSYIYSDTKLDTTQLQTSYTDYEVQSVPTTSRWKYIYIVVSAESNIPTTFTQNVYWYYGKAGAIDLVTNLGTTIKMTMVKGVEIIRHMSNVPMGYYVYGLFLDKDYTIPAIFPMSLEVKTLYAELGTLPTDYFAWDSATSSYYVTKGSSPLPTNLIIPQIYNDGEHGLSSVTYIEDVATFSSGVFASQNTLKNVTFPSTITSIGSYAFSSCSELTSIDLSKCASLTSIGEWAFNRCSGLTSIDLSGCTSLTTISGVNTFGWCLSLTKIILPISLISINSSPFYTCCALAEVYNLSSSLTLTIGSSGNGHVAEYAKVVHTSLSEPTRIKTIGNVQYYDDGTNLIALAPTSRDITSVTLDSKTTVINSHAFYDCNSLTSINLSGLTSLSRIEDRVFWDCSGLTSITLPGSLTSIGSYVFGYCDKLNSIVIPVSVTKIGSVAFKYSALTSITFEDTSTWFCGTQAQQNSMSGGTQIDVSIPSINASYFQSTYYDKYWYKI